MNRRTKLHAPRLSILRHALFTLALVNLVTWSSPASLSAGNVSVSIDRQGNLDIRGDHDRNGNHLEVTVDLVDDFDVSYVIRGKAGTTVNGLAEERLWFYDVHGDVNIRMGYGNDTLDINTLWVHNDLLIDTGPGDDNLSIHAIVYGQMRIHTRAGDDYIFMSNSLVGGDNEPSASGSFEHYKALTIDTGTGDYDVTWMVRNQALGSVELRSSSRRSVIFADKLFAIGHLDIFGNTGNDFVYLFESYVANYFEVHLRLQNDMLFMQGLLVEGDADVHMGLGNDFVHGYAIAVEGSAFFNGGLGRNDFLQLKASHFRDLRPGVNFEGQRIVP